MGDIVERLREPNTPSDLLDFAELMAEEVIASFRAKIADGGLTPRDQADLLTAACGYRDLNIAKRELCTEAADTIERLKSALEWYAEIADSLARKDWKNNPDYAMAIFTELSLDGGNRAREALAPAQTASQVGDE